MAPLSSIIRRSDRLEALPVRSDDPLGFLVSFIFAEEGDSKLQVGVESRARRRRHVVGSLVVKLDIHILKLLNYTL